MRKSADRALFWFLWSRTEPSCGPDFQAWGQPAAAPHRAAQEGRRNQSWDSLAQLRCPCPCGGLGRLPFGDTVLGSPITSGNTGEGSTPNLPPTFPWASRGSLAMSKERLGAWRGRTQPLQPSCPWPAPGRQPGSSPRGIHHGEFWEFTSFFFLWFLPAHHPPHPLFFHHWVARAGLSPLML